MDQITGICPNFLFVYPLKVLFSFYAFIGNDWLSKKAEYLCKKKMLKVFF